MAESQLNPGENPGSEGRDPADNLPEEIITVVDNRPPTAEGQSNNMPRRNDTKSEGGVSESNILRDQLGSFLSNYLKQVDQMRLERINSRSREEQSGPEKRLVQRHLCYPACDFCYKLLTMRLTTLCLLVCKEQKSSPWGCWNLRADERK